MDKPETTNQPFFPDNLEENKAIYNSLQEKLKVIFDSLVRDKINLELQIIESKKFRLAVDSASDHIIITDPDGTIIYANKAVEKVTGYTFDEVVGKTPGKLWGGHMSKDFYAKMWETIHKKEPYKAEMNNVRKNGEPYVAEINVSSVSDERGELLFLVGIERDITKEKEVSQMKNEFVGLVSHQLRTPLTGIRWFVELLLRNKEGNLIPAQLDFLKQISDSNQRMIGLVNDLLDISHLETGHKFDVVRKNFTFDSLVQEVLRDNIVLITDKNLKIVNEIPKTLLVFADYAKLKQVLQNLVSNATKYTLEKKSIFLSVKTDVDKGLIFAVKDEGIGIPKEQLGRMFEKFFRADNASSQDPNGNGLGLYIARGIVRAHSGDMWVESEENKGATFFFSLPIVSAKDQKLDSENKK
jgi:PAS domain S-box-containing protein